ncbi:hypothetical protein BJ085DRAFT_38325 [Dimargaris cristalligena]|uniref:Uncharacterized protein n=1 Tax=Dimargaris cristalligena TaxID=215637 RepID=A0A4Q0A099_9FUNG|nr:hypothetical protein BJ085DRAFT_38325 [Dimargaris cristalligena]|eukprot:RKP39453.1 hypothetical protein BJ085DRAFT_38325 [Dimargaris cristalligena]
MDEKPPQRPRSRTNSRLSLPPLFRWLRASMDSDTTSPTSGSRRPSINQGVGRHSRVGSPIVSVIEGGNNQGMSTFLGRSFRRQNVLSQDFAAQHHRQLEQTIMSFPIPSDNVPALPSPGKDGPPGPLEITLAATGPSPPAPYSVLDSTDSPITTGLSPLDVNQKKDICTEKDNEAVIIPPTNEPPSIPRTYPPPIGSDGRVFRTRHSNSSNDDYLLDNDHWNTGNRSSNAHQRTSVGIVQPTLTTITTIRSDRSSMASTRNSFPALDNPMDPRGISHHSLQSHNISQDRFQPITSTTSLNPATRPPPSRYSGIKHEFGPYSNPRSAPTPPSTSRFTPGNSRRGSAIQDLPNNRHSSTKPGPPLTWKNWAIYLGLITLCLTSLVCIWPAHYNPPLVCIPVLAALGLAGLVIWYHRKYMGAISGMSILLEAGAPRLRSHSIQYRDRDYTPPVDPPLPFPSAPPTPRLGQPSYYPFHLYPSEISVGGSGGPGASVHHYTIPMDHPYHLNQSELLPPPPPILSGRAESNLPNPPPNPYGVDTLPPTPRTLVHPYEFDELGVTSSSGFSGANHSSHTPPTSFITTIPASGQTRGLSASDATLGLAPIGSVDPSEIELNWSAPALALTHTTSNTTTTTTTTAAISTNTSTTTPTVAPSASANAGNPPYSGPGSTDPRPTSLLVPPPSYQQALEVPPTYQPAM